MCGDGQWHNGCGWPGEAIDDDNQDLVRAGTIVLAEQPVSLGLPVKAVAVWAEKVMAGTKVWSDQPLQCLMVVLVMTIWDGEGFGSSRFGESGFRFMSENVKRVE